MKSEYDLEYEASSNIIQSGDFLEFSGKFYDLFKLYNIIKPSELISAFKIPDSLPGRFSWTDLRKSGHVRLVDNPSKMPISLKKYLDENEFVGRVANNHAVIVGDVYYTYYVMSYISDEKIDDPVQYAKKYDVICRKYHLPSLTPLIRMK